MVGDSASLRVLYSHVLSASYPLFVNFPFIVSTFIPSIIHSTLLLWFWCLPLHLISSLLFPCARYTVCNTHLVHGILIPIVHVKWSLVFRCFALSSQRLRLSILVYNNNIGQWTCNFILELSLNFKPLNFIFRILFFIKFVMYC